MNLDKCIFLDTETFCETPINNGTHRYAEGAEIIMWQWAVGDGEVIIRDGDEDVSDLMEMIASGKYTIVIHNSAFDRTVILHATGVEIPIEDVFDTMVCAMAHSLPGALEKLGDILGIAKDKAKDKAGKALIQLFCKPRPKNQILRRATKLTHPVEWEAFREYGRLDIEAMREIYKKLPRWNYRAAEKELWHLDQRINERGVLMDLELSHAAIRASDRAQKELARQAKHMTDGAVESANQRDRMLEHILEAYGIQLADLKGSTAEKVLEDEDIPRELKELLMVRIEASKTSVSKYRRVLNGVSSDGRLRGLLAFCGALRTGRWAGRLLQPQNMRRSSLSDIEVERAIEALLADAEDLV
jgi:DNA polymerase